MVSTAVNNQAERRGRSEVHLQGGHAGLPRAVQNAGGEAGCPALCQSPCYESPSCWPILAANVVGSRRAPGKHSCGGARQPL